MFFCVLWPYFQGPVYTSKVFFDYKRFVWTISLESIDGFWPTFLYRKIDEDKTWLDFGDLYPLFIVT